MSDSNETDTPAYEPEWSEAGTGSQSLNSEYELLRDQFDTQYYMSEYVERQANDPDPLWHFVTKGWREGRNPNSWFSTSDYLQMYPDVADVGVNPFLHYICNGRAEGRKSMRKLGFRYEVVQNSIPVEDRLKGAYRQAGRHDLGSRSDLVNALRSMHRSNNRKLYFSVSHDDFTKNVGGIQLCLQREARAVHAAGFDHIHIFPAIPLPILELEKSETSLGILINTSFEGYFTASAITSAVQEVRLGDWNSRTFALHNLLGHSVNATINILHSLNMKNGFFWIHDFTAGCAGVHLMRNDVQFCGAPDLDSMACDVCLYKPFRAAHISAHRTLFDTFDLTLISPSQAALNIWGHATDRSISDGHIHPHCRLVEREGERERMPLSFQAEAPLRVAFVGLPSSHKGWPVFVDLARAHARDPRYKFFHFGARWEPSSGIEYVEVAASAGGTNQMMDVIENYAIDVAVIWSICPETFCLTAHEAVAAGAAIIAYQDGGNAASFASEKDRGLVLEAEDQLEDLFATGEIVRLSRHQRQNRLFNLQYSGLTADFLEPRG